MWGYGSTEWVVVAVYVSLLCTYKKNFLKYLLIIVVCLALLREAGKLELSAANSELALDFSMAARTYSAAAAAENRPAPSSISKRSPISSSAQQGNAIRPKAMQLYLKSVKAALRCESFTLGLQLFGEWGISSETDTTPVPSQESTQLVSVKAQRQKRELEQKMGRQQGKNRTEVLQRMYAEYVVTAARRSAKASRKAQALQLAGLMPVDARVKLMER